MERHRNWPAECWHFDFEVPVSLSDRYGRMISIAGSVALDARGRQRAPGDLAAQSDLVAREVRMTVEGAGAAPDAIARLVAFYVEDGRCGVDEMLSRLRAGLPGADDASLTALPLRNLAFPGMMLEVEGYAFADGARALPRDVPRSGVVRVGGVTFVDGRASAPAAGGDLETQAAASFARLADALALAGLQRSDVVRLDVRYASPGGMADLERVGRALARGFEKPGPAISFVPLPSLSRPGRLVELDAIAMPGTKEVIDESSWSWGAWPFSQALACGDAIFVGGQVAFDARRALLHPGDVVGQTRLVMDRIVALIGHFGATANDVMKVGCWYRGGADVAVLRRNADVRTSYFTRPGPTSTGVPVDALLHDEALVQIDVVAMTGRS